MEDFSQALSAIPEQSGPYIDFRGVSKAFGDNRVLDNVSFDVMPGETVASWAAAVSANQYRSTTSWGF